MGVGEGWCGMLGSSRGLKRGENTGTTSSSRMRTRNLGTTSVVSSHGRLVLAVVDRLWRLVWSWCLGLGVWLSLIGLVVVVVVFVVVVLPVWSFDTALPLENLWV